jgi:hypothetical protein
VVLLVWSEADPVEGEVFAVRGAVRDVRSTVVLELDDAVRSDVDPRDADVLVARNASLANTRMFVGL